MNFFPEKNVFEGLLCKTGDINKELRYFAEQALVFVNIKDLEDFVCIIVLLAGESNNF